MLTAKVKLLMQICGENCVGNLKSRMLSNAAENDIPSCRSLLYLSEMSQHKNFKESDDVTVLKYLNYLITQKSHSGFLNFCQVLLVY